MLKPIPSTKKVGGAFGLPSLGNKTYRLLTFFSLLLPGVAAAQTQTPTAITPINLGTTAYTQDFNTLRNTNGQDDVLPSGFGFVESGTNANSSYTAYEVSATNIPSSGDTYSFGFGASASTDRAFGSIRSGTVIPQFGFAFTNTTGAAITSLTVSYTGELYRLAGISPARPAGDRLDFQYSTDATSLSTGTYVDVNTLDYAGPVNPTTANAGFDGNDPANRTAITGTITLATPIAVGATFYLRFVDANATDADDALAIDDFSLTAAACNSTAFAYSGSPFCRTGANPTPTVTGTSGGTFSSTSGLVIDAATGAINLATSTAGTYTVTYTYGTACTTTQTVTITAPATAGFSYASTANFCTSNATAVAATLATGATAGTFTSTTGLTIDAATGAITPSTSTPGTYTVTNTIEATGGCAAITATATVTVNPATTATFSYSGSPFCATGTNPTPTVTGTAGGTFASTTGLTIDATTGAINLTASTPGTYTVTYSVAGTCPSSSTQSVTINAVQNAAFSYANASYCVGGTNPTPALATGATAGTFTSTTGLVINGTTGVIDLAASTAGTYTVTNTVAATGCAAATATATVVINEAPTATLTAGGATTFCQGGNVVLTATAGTGNTYQFFNGTTSLGAASATNTFTASAAGSYTVVVTNANGCSTTSAATAIVVNPATTATFTYPGATFCASGTNPVATVTGTAGGAFTSTTGLTIDAATGAITLSSSTPGAYTVTYSVGGTCPSTATTPVTITAAPVASFSYSATANCAGSTGITTPVLGAGASAGTFTSTTGLTIDAATGGIDLATSTAGVYTVTNTVAAANGCAATTATATFTVNERPATPTLTAAFNGTATTLTSSAATGNQFFFNGVAIAGATNQTYEVPGSPASLGSYTVVTTSAQGCASLPSAALVVTSGRKPLAGSSLSVYPNPTPDGRLNVELSGYRKAVELNVFNALGQVVFSATVPASAGNATQLVDLTQLPAGIYILRAKTEGGLDTRRVVKR